MSGVVRIHTICSRCGLSALVPGKNCPMCEGLYAERLREWTSMEEAWLTPQTTRQQDRFAAMNRGYFGAFERDILPHIPRPSHPDTRQP